MRPPCGRWGPAGGAWCTGGRSTSPCCTIPSTASRITSAWHGRGAHQQRSVSSLSLVIQAGELQQCGVHLAMPLPLLPQPDPIPRDGVGAGVFLQRVGIAEDGGSPHIDPVAVMVLVDDGDHGMLLSCPPPSGRGDISHRAVRAPHPHTRLCGPAVGVHPAPRRGKSSSWGSLGVSWPGVVL